ncbi:uncharacterized protein FOMMEDRAFT_160097 [Fomitiporia mediterranea MF3/22]|uniref:uncharacterized protein n=1 Tax=Fomitiporia mediterranea (strain MF3/22) TaxID=694068 RepID=UPI0004408740|nr:uncharacterized protein FOMMEDRAFT_160097 [Fomitiporia mediterranea MF3/22]EJC99671.1 hypothetical protein FOMMEDRAFT_160097 [Fomitiporia mediterranea MF3/22]
MSSVTRTRVFTKPTTTLSKPTDPHEKPDSIFMCRWVYGYWLKNKHMRLFAERRNLDWNRNAGIILFKIMDQVLSKTKIFFFMRPAKYRGQPAMIVGFVHDVRMRKVDESEYPQAHIDTVREAIGLSKGTKPRWYEINGQEYDPDVDPESEDEERMVYVNDSENASTDWDTDEWS